MSEIEARNAADAHEEAEILIVDDDEDFVRAMRRVLRSWGFASRFALSGAEALQLCALRSPKIALVDVMMPEMDGWQLSEALAQRPDPPAVILVSGSFKAPELHASSTIVATLPKPVRNSILRELLTRRLEGPGPGASAEAMGPRREAPEVPGE
ncbi:MAG: response regulator, partial [Myxococcales bacterium]|nr:response regulator [Myxococcales bacterium]